MAKERPTEKLIVKKLYGRSKRKKSKPDTKKTKLP
jgi:hypothetical protein